MRRHTNSFHVPERFLRQIWKHRDFATPVLQTTDGQPIVIISPGKSNPDGGPDFIDARIRVGNVLYRGDVELHQNCIDWSQHEHHLDPKYNTVILHVVFRRDPSETSTLTKSRRSVPVLVLEPHLVSTQHSLWDKMIRDERSERLATIKCCSLNDVVEPLLIQRWLQKLAIERFELKVRRFEERLKELVDDQKLSVKEPSARYEETPFGLNPEDLPSPVHRYSQRDFGKIQLWEQLLFEGCMEALGFSKNQESFLKLARNLKLQFFKNHNIPPRDILQIEAILFGVAGLLPPVRSLDERPSRKHVQELRRTWRKMKPLYRNETLTEAEWQFFRLRPENFPTVRLAAAAQLISRMLTRDFFKTLVQTIKDAGRDTAEKLNPLRSTFIIAFDGFWQRHFRFGEESRRPLRLLIGKSRSDDIVVNIVLPICLLYARIFKDKGARQAALKICEEYPPLSHNAIIRMMDGQLTRGKCKLDSAMLQQGALQLYKFYCVEERCKECVVGKIVFRSVPADISR